MAVSSVITSVNPKTSNMPTKNLDFHRNNSANLFLLKEHSSIYKNIIEHDRTDQRIPHFKMPSAP